MENSHSASYAAAGVDIEAGYKGVKLMSQHVARTVIPGVVSDLGGFGGLFAPDLTGMSEPVLVSGTDGVGTKQRIAQLLDKHDTVGIDCVAMCVNDIICCGALSIDPRLRRVSRDGTEIPLTPKEFDILCFLARNRGEVFTKEQIYQAVWESDYLLDDSNIMAFIRKLRKKIEPNPDAPEYILTIWGIGYKFSDKL